MGTVRIIVLICLLNIYVIILLEYRLNIILIKNESGCFDL